MAMFTARILRFDPSVDAEPHFETYDVEVADDPSGIFTALQVLFAVNHDCTCIAFDHNCDSGLCGRCGILVDGKPGLACWTRIEPGEHTFEPLPGFPVIRDLVVDKSRARQKFVQCDTSCKTVDPIVTLADCDYDLYWETLERLNMCRECMHCYTVCPQMNGGKWASYVGPGALAQIAQRHLDPEDQADRISEAVFAGLWDCIGCGACDAVCPSGIRHVELFKQMKTEARERGLARSDA